MNINVIILAKYIIAIVLIALVLFAPAYLARQTNKDKTDMVRIRIGSWLLGWSVVAWIWALFASIRK